MGSKLSKSEKAKQLIPLEQARNSLVKLWFLGSGVIFALLIAQSILGKYGDDLADVWSWFVPTTVPTLMLMIGVIGGAAMHSGKDLKVRKNIYDISKWLSLAYLIVLAGTILSEPYAKAEPIKLFKLSNYWLTPVQGLAVAAIGFLFSSKQEKDGTKSRAASGERRESSQQTSATNQPV